MKKTTVLIGLALSLVALMLIAPALAITYSILDYQIANNGKIWRISTTDQLGNSFSGKDVIEVHAYYWLTAQVEPNGELVPTRIHKHEGKITLYFDSAEIQQLSGTVIYTKVNGTIVGGDTFIATGPGFAWGRTR
jgi:hypothetical protein